ncbi:predicted protein [Ostreococcus lucimarinus CCE9901]|uniref:Uncharacterized protein n=1 Tax=Ostreococcus lucimarinus (strain CCE9901) TaxID=436017 RepID=A4S074_OSTLU|nr:predicted protein [Ostreococcus lucimarinus CCE9901]ABO97218.1 predicted protein [Ostreococcus lucimarinus CCE9901]|eukprot:XP_001418925.1 predicted protein [Ostreococcus lucimarinus CCE9901]
MPTTTRAAFGDDVDACARATSDGVDVVCYRRRRSTRAPPLARVRARGTGAREREREAFDALRATMGTPRAWTANAEGCAMTPRAGERAEARAALETFIHERIFRALFGTTTAATAAGDAGVFAPHRGTNVMWHRDGYMAGAYVAHAILAAEEEEEEASGGKWFEHALVDADEDEESTTETFEVDFENQGILSKSVRKGNFVPIDARGGVLCVFEDAAVLHRSPKSAGKALDAMTRTIARFNFSAVDGSGRTVRIFAPDDASWTPFDDRGAVRGLTAMDGFDAYVRDS